MPVDAASERNLKSKPMTPGEAKRTERKVEMALHKHEREEPLTEHEWMIFQYARHVGGCHACGALPLGA